MRLPNRLFIFRGVVNALTVSSVTFVLASWCAFTISCSRCSKVAQAEPYIRFYPFNNIIYCFRTSIRTFFTSPVIILPAPYSMPILSNCLSSSRKKFKYFQGTSTERLAPASKQKNFLTPVQKLLMHEQTFQSKMCSFLTR